jgi:hypothetical protein
MQEGGDTQISLSDEDEAYHYKNRVTTDLFLMGIYLYELT